MRVADTTLAAELAGRLDAQQATINSLNDQLSSGLALQQPSDNPVAVVNTLSYERQAAQLQSAQSSATTALAWLGTANGAANSILSALGTVRSLVLQALNSGAQNTATYRAMASQVQGQFQSLVELANTTYGTTPIFAGTAGVSSAYTASGTYQGNNASFDIAFPNGQKVNVSVSGTAMFGGTGGVQSLFTTLGNLITHLNAGPSATTQSNLQADLSSLDANVTQARNAATKLGAWTDQVQAIQSAVSATSTQIQTVLANTKDVNIAAVTTQLQQDLVSYQAALYVTSKTIPETLAALIA